MREDADVAADPYDALLLVSFGGPESVEEVMPFLRRVTQGRGVPDDRLAQVAEHYYAVGGRSPINDQNRALLAALRPALQQEGVGLPIVWGNRNSAPFLVDALAELSAAGKTRVLALVTSAYSSYSGCRQYREDLAAAAEEVTQRGLVPPTIDKVRAYFDHPGFVSAFIDATSAAVSALPADRHDGTRLLFCTHSIPVSAARSSGPDGDGYVAQHRAVATLVADGVAEHTGIRLPWDLVFQSRSGSPTVPWLEPDINDQLGALAATGTTDVVVVPIGFVSDHLEVGHDLDTEAAETAATLGVGFVRVATPGVAPGFVAGLVSLIRERVDSGPVEALSDLGPAPDWCSASCCPNPRQVRPAVAESS